MKNTERVRIMVFGTFDVIHNGHIYFFRQAKKLVKNSYLIVSVARNKNVLKIKKKMPSRGQFLRMEDVRQTKIPDCVILGAVEDYIGHIVKAKPSIIALGHDQKEYTKDLKKKLANQGLAVRVVRLKPYKRHVYKSSLIKKLHKK